MEPKDFFTEYGEANRYTIKEVIGKGSYGVVCSATDNYTGETVSRRSPVPVRCCEGPLTVAGPPCASGGHQENQQCF